MPSARWRHNKEFSYKFHRDTNKKKNKFKIKLFFVKVDSIQQKMAYYFARRKISNTILKKNVPQPYIARMAQFWSAAYRKQDVVVTFAWLHNTDSAVKQLRGIQ